MKRIIQLLTALLITFVVTGCGGAKLSPEQQALFDSQAEVYTQVPMWTENNRVYGTNYSRGMLIPINTKVKLLDASSKAIVFEYNGQKITYLIFTKHTRADTATMIKRLFAKKPVDLTKYPHAKEIKDAHVVKGMSKDEVILARGYPPFHMTHSLEADQWKYWRHRFSTAIVTFKDGKVVDIRGNL